MDQVLCFHIQDVDLYLEQVLVEYNNIPIFFVCTDFKSRFLVLCTDTDEYSYYIIRIGIYSLCAMLEGSIPMRNCFTGSPSFWEVISGEEVGEDQVFQRERKDMDISALPDEGACYEVLDQLTKSYYEQVHAELYDANAFMNISIEEETLSEDDSEKEEPVYGESMNQISTQDIYSGMFMYNYIPEAA